MTEPRELYSGLIRLHVLHHGCHEPFFGLWMIEELSRHRLSLESWNALPAARGQMERRGLLRSSRERVNGKFRRMYRATPAGRAALRIAKKRVQELFGELFEDER